MGPLGPWELIIIFLLALVFFGPRKLPELGRSLGKSLSEFKRASHELRSTLDEEIRLEDRRAASAATAAPAAPSAAAPPVSTEAVDEIADDATPADTVARGGQHA